MATKAVRSVSVYQVPRRRSASSTRCPPAWFRPTIRKGRPNSGESPEAAALREVQEETGYRAVIVGRLPGTFPGGTSVTGFYLMRPVGAPVPHDDETSALTWALYGDVADYGEVKYGRRSTGLISSASLFSIKSGILIGGFLVPLFLAKFGYVKGAESQTASALLGITLAFSIGPALFAILKAVALMIYPLDQRRVDEIERELASRRAANAEVQPA